MSLGGISKKKKGKKVCDCFLLLILVSFENWLICCNLFLWSVLISSDNGGYTFFFYFLLVIESSFLSFYIICPHLGLSHPPYLEYELFNLLVKSSALNKLNSFFFQVFCFQIKKELPLFSQSWFFNRESYDSVQRKIYKSFTVLTHNGGLQGFCHHIFACEVVSEAMILAQFIVLLFIFINNELGVLFIFFLGFQFP